MKLAARLTNERGNAKTMADDTRIQVELTYKNKIIGTLGLYAIHSDKGYRVVWNNTVIAVQEDGYCNGKHESVQAILKCPVCKNDPLLN